MKLQAVPTIRQVLAITMLFGAATGCAAKDYATSSEPAGDVQREAAPKRGASLDDAVSAEEQEAPADEAVAAKPVAQNAAPATKTPQAPPPAQPVTVATAERRDVSKNEDAKLADKDVAAAPPMEPVKAEPAPSPDPAVVEPSESNAQGEEYTNPGVNPMTDTNKDRLSTFSIDVDTGAYTIARRKLNEGYLPPADAVRVEEYVNYFGYNYPNPDSGAFGVYMEAAPSPFTAAKGRYLMRVGVQGKRLAPSERKPVHLTFLVDVSGSMNSQDKLPLAKQALKILTNNLREGDSVALVTYAGATRVVLEHTDASNKGKIIAALDDLTSGGGTSMGSGMELAYKQAMTKVKPGHVSRVIVLSDGDANIGPMSHQDILKQIKAYVDEGVTMSTIGLGMGNYRDTLMEQLANKGNGNYYYIDSIDEARKVFGEQVDGTLEVIAKDVKIQVEFNPKTVAEYRLIGYENRDIRDQDFRDDKVDAGEIGAGHTVTAFYEVVLRANADAQGDWATVRVRHKQPEGHVASEQTFMMSGREVRAKVSEASKDFQFGSSVVAFAEILRRSPYAKGLTFDLVEELAIASSSPNQKDRAEFIELVRRAKKLSKG
jgi:Ca-activated chloride channel family protein